MVSFMPGRSPVRREFHDRLEVLPCARLVAFQEQVAEVVVRPCSLARRRRRRQ